MSSPEDDADPAPASAADSSSPVSPSGDSTVAPDETGSADLSPVPVGLLDDARERLRTERRILGDERAAFQAFADRLLDADGPIPTAAVESHYRWTVMPFPTTTLSTATATPRASAPRLGQRSPSTSSVGTGSTLPPWTRSAGRRFAVERLATG